MTPTEARALADDLLDTLGPHKLTVDDQVVDALRSLADQEEVKDKIIRQQGEVIETIRLECDAMKKDAERYWYIRSNCLVTLPDGTEVVTQEQLDRAREAT